METNYEYQKYFMDLSVSKSNYDDIITFSKNMINNYDELSPITKIVENPMNGKTTLMRLLRRISNINIIHIGNSGFDMYTRHKLNYLTVPTCIVVDDPTHDFFQVNYALMTKIIDGSFQMRRIYSNELSTIKIVVMTNYDDMIIDEILSSKIKTIKMNSRFTTNPVPGYSKLMNWHIEDDLLQNDQDLMNLKEFILAA
jgi:hypothetical protein